MIEDWGYFVTVGAIIIGFGAGLHWLLKYDDKYKKKLDDNEAIVKTNFFEEWLNKIEAKVKGTIQISDTTINTELKRLFNIAGLFERCKYLDERNRGSVKYIQIAVIFSGIFIALYSITDVLSKEINIIYYAGALTTLIFIIIAVYYKIKISEKLENKVEQLTKNISLKITEDLSEGGNNS